MYDIALQMVLTCQDEFSALSILKNLKFFPPLSFLFFLHKVCTTSGGFIEVKCPEVGVDWPSSKLTLLSTVRARIIALMHV